MLPWYSGVFSHGFIALHPFFTVDGLDPSTCDYGTLNVAASDRPDGVDLLEWMDELSASRREGKELAGSSIDDIAKRFGQRVSWRSIGEQAGFSDIRSLDLALRSHIMGLRREHEDRGAAKRLTEYCTRQRIFLPTEGEFQATMEADVVGFLERAGFYEVIVGDEFGEDEKLIALESLASPAAWETRQDFPKFGAKRLIAPDHSMLVWVHWDSFYTAVFGTSDRIRESRISEVFEGFWCSNETTTYWLLDDADGR